MSVTKLWWLSLGIAMVVVGVVAGLLGRIITAATSVDRHAADIWTTGKQIAGNTVAIWMLDQTNNHLEQITDTVRSVEQTAASMDDKLRTLAGTTREGS